MTLSSGQRQYLLIGQCIIPFAINFVLNGIIGLLAFSGVWAKALFSGVLGGVVTPIIGLVALAEREGA